MKKFLLATVTLSALTSITPALAAGNAVDKGVAYTAIYAKYCNANDIPTRVERLLDIYLQTRYRQVEAELKEIMAEFDTIDMDKATAMNMWCKLMKPEVARIMRSF